MSGRSSRSVRAIAALAPSMTISAPATVAAATASTARATTASSPRLPKPPNTSFAQIMRRLEATRREAATPAREGPAARRDRQRGETGSERGEPCGRNQRSCGYPRQRDRGYCSNRDTTAEDQGELKSVIDQNLSWRKPDSLQNSIIPPSAKDSLDL